PRGPARPARAPPVVRRRTRFQPDHTARQSTEERQNLRTPKLLAQNRRSLCINPVHLKNMLRQVQSDRRNLAHGWLPFAAVSIRQQFGTQMPQRGHPPHHSITSSARASSVGGIVRPKNSRSPRGSPSGRELERVARSRIGFPFGIKAILQ